MNKYNVVQHVDYITASVTEFAPIDDVFSQVEPFKPTIGNYATAKRYKSGMIVQWHPDKPQLKTHITLSGSTLDNMRIAGFDDSEIVQWIANMNNAKFGRIDLAITSNRNDGGIHGFLPHFAHFCALAGWCDTSMELDKPVTDKNLNIQTAYIGQRKKRQMLRIYDKGIDLGEEANKLIRIEMERRGSVAQTIARDVINKHNYAGVIKRYFDFPQVEAWNEIMSCETIPRTNANIQSESTKNDDNEKLWHWLFSSAAPALARAMYESTYDVDSSPFVDEFAKIVADEYNRLVDNGL